MNARTLRTIRIVASLITFLSIALIVFLLISNNGCVGGFDVSHVKLRGEAGAYADSGKYEISGPVSDLEISWNQGNIRIEVDDGATVRFEETAAGPLTEKTALRYAYRDGVLQIVQRETPFGSFFDFNNHAKDLVVRWPRRALAELERASLNAVSAGFDIAELRVTDTLKIDTVSGDVTLGSIAAGTFDFETVSGSLEAGRIEAAAIDLDAVSGSADLAVAGVTRIDADSVSGSVRLRLAGIDRVAVDFEAVSGKQTAGDGVVISSDAPVRIRMGSVSGDLRLERVP